MNDVDTFDPFTVPTVRKRKSQGSTSDLTCRGQSQDNLRSLTSSTNPKLSCLVVAKMPSCSAPGCKNRYENGRERGLTFHRLPTKNIKLAKKWLEQLRRDERLVPKHLYVCNEHFTDDCFKTEYRFELLGGNTRRRSLKKDAFRTIFQRKVLINKAEERKEVVNLLETKHTSAECKEILEDGKGEHSSNPVQNVVNEYTSAVTFKQMMIVSSTENQVLSSSLTDDMVVGDKISHGDVKVHTPLEIPVPGSASSVTFKQGVETAGAGNHIIGSPTHMAKMKATSTENQVLSSGPTVDVVVRDKILHGDVKVHTPLEIPVPGSASAVTSKQGVEIAGAVNHIIGRLIHMAKMKVTSTETQVLNSSPTDDMVVGDKISHGDVKVHTPLQIPLSRSASAVTSKQGVEIAGAGNHVIVSPTDMAKMKVTSTETQVLSSGPTDDMVVRRDKILHGDVKVHTPLQIPVSGSASAVTSKQGVEIAGAGNHVIVSPTDMAKMKVTSAEVQVLSSGPPDDMVVGDKISHGDDMVIRKEMLHRDVKVHTSLQIPVSRSASAVTSKQGVSGAGNHIIGSPTDMAKGVLDCMLLEDMSLYDEVEMHKPVQIQELKSSSAVTTESTANVATINHVFSGPVHIIEIETNMGKTHVQSVHVDVGMQTDPLTECSPVFDTTMTLSMKRKLVDQDHTYCKKKLEPWPKQPKCTTSQDVKDEVEQNIDSSDDEWEAEIEEADIDNDSDEDWVPEDEEVETDDEDYSDDKDLDS